ncbi:carbonic anhydrase [Nitrosomonas sp. PY1]|uniref:carbonic anhydrase n=1 Tax=Nitrosomonas sp. PY1 TaxID=1803906 RepID=UPI001FC7DF88|nr:carbonic anhydrase [Nitrosomonas sp. PY1]GKS69136.1 carbonic anhydrase [Nitrosomonas sp. PY1]
MDKEFDSNENVDTHELNNNRRGFLRMSAAFTMGLGMLHNQVSWAEKGKESAEKTYSNAAPKPENILTPDDALERLMEGNKRYITGKAIVFDFHEVEKSLVNGQNPFATILGCSDSRVSPEHCFDAEPGDLFVVRGAGNYLTNDNVASIEYAVEVLKTPLIMVLGHESCGAVKAAVEAVDSHKNFPGHIQLLASAIAPAVRRVSDTSRSRLINVTKANVIRNVEALRLKTPVIDSYHDEKKVRVVGGIYHLKTGVVEIIA